MKVGGSVIRFGLSVLVLLSIGCDQANFNLGSLRGPEQETKTAPFAVLSMAPTRDCYAKLVTFTTNDDEPVALSDKELQKRLPGIDHRRRAAAVLYKSASGDAEPLVYLPVADYERFVDGLARRVKLKRAVASRFTFGPRELLVMHVGNYAVIGMSLQAIKQGPQSPEPFLQGMPEDADFAFKWNSRSADKRVKRTFIHSLKNSLGVEFSQLVAKSKQLVCSMNIDSSRNVEFHAQVSSGSENSDQVQAELNEVFAAHAWKASTETNEDFLAFDVAFPSDQVNSTWAKLKPLAKNYFQSQRGAIANCSSSDGPFGSSRTFDSGDGGIMFPAGAFSSGCSTTRRG